MSHAGNGHEAIPTCNSWHMAGQMAESGLIPGSGFNSLGACQLVAERQIRCALSEILSVCSSIVARTWLAECPAAVSNGPCHA